MSIEAIKEALAAGPTDGPWEVKFRKDHSCFISMGSPSAEHKQFDLPFDDLYPSDVADAAFIAACNPVAIRSLIERLEAAEKDAARLDWLTKQFRVMSLDMGGNHCWALARSGSIRGPNMTAAIDSAMGLSPAKSAGELQAVNRSPQVQAPERLHPLHAPRPDAGLVSGHLPQRVPPTGMEHQGNDASPGHQFNGGGPAGGSGVSGGLEAGRSGNGGLAEGVSDA